MTAKIDRVTIKVFFNIVLPVQIMNFKAIQQEDKVKLEWAIASEINSHHFTVERSADGATGWQPINTVAGATNHTITDYQVTDPAPLSINFYRLRQTDMNGSSTFSNIIALHFKKEKVDLLVYPNPVHDEITILFPGKADRILLKNISGGYVVVKNISPIAGRGIKVKLPALQKGYYWLTIQTAQRSYTKKIMVL